MSITIRPAQTPADFDATIDITLKAWGTSLDDAMPSHAMQAIAHNSGTVLLAFDGQTPVGFCLSIFAFDGDSPKAADAQFKHYSHLAGVLPAYRGRGVGEMLKWAQRTAVLAQNVPRITWTFDPLQTLNARLNMHKLGAVCNTYIRNRYGKLDDALNGGLPTDRFEVDWWIASDWVEAHAHKTYRSPTVDQLTNATRINSAIMKNGWLQPQSTHLSGWEDQLLLTVPKNFVEMRGEDLELALAWRYHARELFEVAFAGGFTAVDLLVEPERCYYLLRAS